MSLLCTEPLEQAVSSTSHELRPKTKYFDLSLRSAALISPENSAIQTREQMSAVVASSGMPDGKLEALTDRLRRNMVALVRDVVFFYRLLRHADTPWYARGLLCFPVMYLCSPVQLMPNFISVVGQVDDLFVIWITKKFVVKLIDQKTCQECQDLAPATELPFSQQLANLRRRFLRSSTFSRCVTSGNHLLFRIQLSRGLASPVITSIFKAPSREMWIFSRATHWQLQRPEGELFRKGLRSEIDSGPLLRRVALASLLSIIFQSGMAAVGQNRQAPPATGKPADAGESEDLAKAAQNPVASLISVPLQNNTAFGIGPYNRTQNVLNIQPVIPVRISENWNLISRIIQPVVWQPDTAQNTRGWFGFGDMNPSFFFSPAKPHKLIWGAGPTFVFPTATADQLGQGKLSMGPAVVLLTTPGHWVIGVLVNNAWSVAGSGGRTDVNQMVLQWFVNYNMKKGWYVVTSPIVTADWKQDSGNQATIPFGGGIGRIMRLGFQPVNITAQFYGNVVHPTGASPWGMRLQIQFLYPKKPK